VADYDWSRFRGYRVPHHTEVPDELFDEQLRYLGYAELKVLLWIVRKTFGWRKDSDAISLSQLIEGTGLGPTSVKRAVKDLESKGAITVKRDLTKQGDSAVNTYGLRLAVGGRPTEDLPSARKGPHKIHSDKRERLTESELNSAAAKARVLVASDDSVSDELHAACEETATALQRPAEARQLETWARRQEIPVEIIRAAGEATIRHLQTGGLLKKPVAYLQTVAKVLLSDRQQAAEVGKRTAARRRADATALAREVFADRIIGGSWRQAEAIVRESYGAKLAAETIRELVR